MFILRIYKVGNHPHVRCHVDTVQRATKKECVDYASLNYFANCYEWEWHYPVSIH